MDLHLAFEGYKVDHLTIPFFKKSAGMLCCINRAGQIILSILILSPIFFTANNNTLLNNVASVVQADIEAEDGVVHIISHVLIPSTLSPTGIGGIVG